MPSKPREIVGMVYVKNPGPWWVPPGLESTQGPGAKPVYYRSPFFGGTREYMNDEDGWQTPISRRQRRLARRRNQVIDDEDAYDFDDSY